MTNFVPNSTDLTLVELALQEDLGLPYSDATTKILFAGDQRDAEAKIISKHATDIVVSGAILLPYLAKKFGSELNIVSDYQDGEVLPSGATLLTLQSTAATLLILERTILNFLRHLCAVATLTGQFVERVKHTQCKILDTRKTTPGWRHLEKYAVQCGGGVNHRHGLYDAIMVKDTHVDLLGGMEQALAKLPAQKMLPTIIEVRDLKELEIALAHREKIDRILLDNMRGNLLAECVYHCQKVNMPTEASGNLSLDNITAVAESGVDFASVGALTHSAGQVDLSMKIN